MRRRVFVGGLLAVLFLAGWWAGRGRASGGLYENLDVFVEVLHAVQTSYVDPVEPASLVAGGVRGLLHDLDPYSEYFDERAYAKFNAALSEGVDGVGVSIDLHQGVPIVISTLEGSPAWEAGLLPGDALLRIDGKSTQSLAVPEIEAALRGTPGTKVTLNVDREGDTEPHDLVLTRKHLETPAVTSAFVAAPGVGYVRLARFSERAGADVRAAVDTLRARGVQRLVLDLRNNPGGLVEQAADVAQQFVPEGTLLAYTKGRNPAAGQRYTAAKGRGVTAWPMAVLVDGGSASAAEIVAGALQDLDRAVIVGTPTYGKAAVQSVFPLRHMGGAVKLTTAYYFTPSGRSIQRPRPGAGVDEADDSPADSSDGPRPAFRTHAGRTVFGGGGILPDVQVQPDSLPALARAVEGHGLAQGIAGTRPAGDPAGDFEALLRAARGAGFGTSDAEVADARPWLERALRRERARRTGGASAAARVTLERDPAFERAVALLRGARVPHDVFAAVPEPKPGRAGGAR